MTERTEHRFCIACGYHIEPHDECKYVECPMRNPIRDTGDALGQVLADALKATNGEPKE